MRDFERDGQPLLPLHAQDVHRALAPREVRPRQPVGQEANHEGDVVGHTEGSCRLGEKSNTTYSNLIIYMLGVSKTYERKTYSRWRVDSLSHNVNKVNVPFLGVQVK